MRFKLATTLHMTLLELDERVTVEEFDLWRAYFIHESNEVKKARSQKSTSGPGKGKITGTLGRNKA